MSSFRSAWIQCFCACAIGTQYVPDGSTLAAAERPYGVKSGTDSGDVSRYTATSIRCRRRTSDWTSAALSGSSARRK